jgi:sugar O-acyltransferase (sialic acid O-acetyltransferase NeuD family)
MNKNPIGIIGYGELGKQLELLALSCGWENNFIYFDDLHFDRENENTYPFRDYLKEDFKHLNFLVGIGYKKLALRSKIFRTLVEKQRSIPSLVHPTAFIHPSAHIDGGVYIYPLCNVDKNVVLERGVVLNNSVVISHDTRIDQACFLSPGVILSSFCRIGACSFLGAGTVVSNKVIVGNNVTIGIGTVVSKNLEPGKFYIGNPVKEVKDIELK